MPLYDVQALLGHEDYATTQRYAHLAPDAHGKVLESWSRRNARRISSGRLVTAVNFDADWDWLVVLVRWDQGEGSMWAKFKATIKRWREGSDQRCITNLRISQFKEEQRRGMPPKGSPPPAG